MIRSEFIQVFARYFVVGGLAALTDWTVFALLIYLASLPYLLAAVISFVAATWLNYVLATRFVFSNRRHDRNMEIFLIYVVSFIGALINLSVLSGLIEYGAVHAIAAKITGTASALIWNFSIRYFWLYKT